MTVAPLPNRFTLFFADHSGQDAKQSRVPAQTVAAPSPTKKQIVLDLLRRDDGATTAEIAQATGWRNHTVRGFISGHVSKQMGLAVESERSENGVRRYQIRKFTMAGPISFSNWSSNASIGLPNVRTLV
jgi:hypothetical protein